MNLGAQLKDTSNLTFEFKELFTQLNDLKFSANSFMKCHFYSVVLPDVLNIQEIRVINRSLTSPC